MCVWERETKTEREGERERESVCEKCENGNLLQKGLKLDTTSGDRIKKSFKCCSPNQY